MIIREIKGRLRNKIEFIIKIRSTFINKGLKKWIPAFNLIYVDLLHKCVRNNWNNKNKPKWIIVVFGMDEIWAADKKRRAFTLDDKSNI